MRPELPEWNAGTKVMIRVACELYQTPPRPASLGVPCLTCFEPSTFSPPKSPVPYVVDILECKNRYC